MTVPRKRAITQKMMSLMKPILDAEERVAKATVERYGEQLALIDKALELFIDRVGLFGNKKLGSLSKLQAARLHLTVRSIKSVRMAKASLICGYYQQAITLLRMVAENDLVIRDTAIFKATLDGLLLDIPLREEDSDDIQIPKFSEMARRQSSAFGRWWDWYYGKLSIYGAHPRNASMSNLGHRTPIEKGYILKIEAFYDEASIEPILCIMDAELWRMFEMTHELVKTANKEETILDQPELLWNQEGLIDIGKSLYLGGYRYIFRVEDWQGTEGQGK